MAIKGSVRFATLVASLFLACEGRGFASEVDEPCAADASTCSTGGSAMMQQTSVNRPVKEHVMSQAQVGKSFDETKKSRWAAKYEEDRRFQDLLNQTLLAQGSEPNVGLSAELNENGYQSVLKAKSDSEMGLFVLRVVDKMNMSVIATNGTDAHPVFSFVSWYSGTKSSQSFAGLQKELNSIQRKCSWIKPRSFIEAESGKDALLTEDGYQSVARQRDSSEMTDFVLRVMDDLKMHMVDEDGLRGFVPYFDCTQGAQTYDELRTELEKRATEGVWVDWN